MINYCTIHITYLKEEFTLIYVSTENFLNVSVNMMTMSQCAQHQEAENDVAK